MRTLTLSFTAAVLCAGAVLTGPAQSQPYPWGDVPPYPYARVPGPSANPYPAPFWSNPIVYVQENAHPVRMGKWCWVNSDLGSRDTFGYWRICPRR